MSGPANLPLSGPERAAVHALLEWARRPPRPELVRALLFGSRARGDHDETSDVDVLLVFAERASHRRRLALAAARAARSAARDSAAPLQTWTLTIEDLAPGRRTPMLVDAFADAVTLWPPGAPPACLSFMPADARFCAGRLLRWVESGPGVALRALIAGQRAAAARRVRDDITRLACAALLLTGDTRHRRSGTIRRFADVFLVSPEWRAACLPALGWASRAYPRDDGRGRSHAPVTARAIASVREGLQFAAAMRERVVPWIRRRLRPSGGTWESVGARATRP